MKDDEYELLPHREIVKLREEVERLKTSPISSEAANLVSALSKLNESVSRLIRIFEVAEKELAQEYKQSKVEEKINRVVYQNKEIAKGIIAVADLIKKRQPSPTPPGPSVSPPSPPEAQPPSLEPEPVHPGPVPSSTLPGAPESGLTPSFPTEDHEMVPPPEKKKILSWFAK